MQDGRRVARDGYDWFGRKFNGNEAGSVFSVPLPDGTYAFGRLMNAKDGANIAEFFRARRNTPEFDPAILQAGRLFGPVGVLAGDIEGPNRKRPWKVVHKDPEYYPDDLYDIPFFRGTGAGTWRYFTLNDDREILGPVADKDVGSWKVASVLPQYADEITDMIVWNMEQQGL